MGNSYEVFTQDLTPRGGVLAAPTQASEKAAWTQHKQIERGNEIRVYMGQKFKLK